MSVACRSQKISEWLNIAFHAILLEGGDALQVYMSTCAEAAPTPSGLWAMPGVSLLWQAGIARSPCHLCGRPLVCITRCFSARAAGKCPMAAASSRGVSRRITMHACNECIHHTWLNGSHSQPAHHNHRFRFRYHSSRD
jgi:hypothetical protein